MTETSLGEIDRSRSIYQYASQFCDPRIVVSFWKKFHDFEVGHGNEETFREMLRIKRSVSAKYSQGNQTAADTLTETQHIQSDADVARKEAEKLAKLEGGASSGNIALKRIAMGKETSDMQKLEAQASSILEQTKNVSRSTGEQKTEDMNIEEKAIPSDVYGGLTTAVTQAKKSKAPEDTIVGAMERFRKRRKVA